MLETTWFLLWGLLWAIYFVLDGFDLGLGTAMPFIAKSEKDKQIILHSMGPFWDGNEVWLVAAGGVTFAAFPGTYAVMFSGLYTALMLLLFGLIIRGVSLEFRHQVQSRAWSAFWDLGVFVGSFLPALLLGVAFANIFKGIPIDAEGIFQGTLLTLLNPYGLLGGLLFLVLFMVHGLLWLGVRSEGELQERAGAWVSRLWSVLVILAVLFLAASAWATNLLTNYLANPALLIIVLLPLAGLYGIRHYLGQARYWLAWAASGLTIFGTALFGVIGIYPALLPSSLDPAYSMTVTNSSSSTLTLKIMLGVALVFVPIVILYQLWAYKTFSHTITDQELAEHG